MRLMKYAVICGLLAGTAYALTWNDVKTVITGHTNDAISRLAHTDEIISGGIIGTGMIDEDAEGQDLIHNAKGTIGFVSAGDGYYVQLGNDFNSSPGPDYHVYISVGSDIDNEKDFNFFKSYELGPLKAGKGATYYKVSNDIYDQIDHLQAFSVVIWCKQFGEYIGSATIEWDINEQ